MHLLSIDLETYSPVNLKTAGAYKYAEKAEILLFAYSINGSPVHCFDLTKEDLPDEITGYLTDPDYLKIAFNASFERAVLNAVLGIYTPPEQWECTLVRSAMAGLPLSLDESSKALGLLEKKDWTGKALIRYFCVPCKPTKANGMRERNLPEHDPAKWQQFIGYCKQDVVTEMAIGSALSWLEIPAIEKRLWCLDQRCNERGVSVDLELLHKAIELDMMYRDVLLTEAVQLTGLKNANSVAQLKKWFSEELDDEVKTLSKGAVEKLLNKVKSDNIKVHRVLEIRSLLAKSSIKKYVAMLNAAGSDGRIRGMFQFYGANRTGRDAGRLAQPQNYPRILMDEDILAACRKAIKIGDWQFVEACFDTLPSVLSQLTRTAFVPGKGNVFKVSDFRSVEAVVLAWLAGEQKVLDLFNKHPKIYEATASIMFNISIEDIKKGSDIYQKGKVSNLAFGFQGAVNAIINMMDSLGMVGDKRIPDKELPGLVRIWRENHPHIVQFWYDLDKAARNTIKTKYPHKVGKHIRFEFKNNNLLMFLPSGRFLCYHGAHVREVWSVKGRILGYRTDTCWLNKFKITDALVSWAQQSIQPHVKKTDAENPDMDEAGKLTLLANLTFENKVYDLLTFAQVNEIANVQRKELILFWGTNQTTKKWEVTSTYGGKLAENATQATARDCLMNGVINIEDAGYPVVMRVHDETVTDSPEDNLDEINQLMTKPANWMKGLPLKAEGFAGMYYQK